MPSTPPPTSLRARARTPPTPLHGDYEPYSPRRSTRSTAHSNPYSSFNSPGRSQQPHQQYTPPSTIAREKAPASRLTPPSSPASPALPKVTPLRRKRKPAGHPGAGVHSDSSDAAPSASRSHKLALPNIDRDTTTMLPTPSKTPQRRGMTSTTGRILSFHPPPSHPNDVMPTPRQVKKQQHRRGRSTSMAGFELYSDDETTATGKGSEIPIYTDANARVPEVDESEDNPFVGPRQRRRACRSAGKMKTRTTDQVQIEEAARRDEGVTYVFRGKKIFRKFSSPSNPEASSSVAGTDPEDLSVSGTPEQRRLKRQAGAAAQRPLTRSAIRPRLLFPSEEQVEEREVDVEVDDEEAVTDIDVDVEMVDTGREHEHDLRTPLKKKVVVFEATPPPTISTRATRSAKKTRFEESPPTPVAEDEIFQTSTLERKDSKGRSPFDAWQRTKNGRNRKRAGDEEVEGVNCGNGGGKRTRSARFE